VGDLQLGRGVGAVGIDEHHEHLVALDMRCDHGEHLVFPAELREVVHQGDGGLVDLEGREADFVAECEVCDEIADARSGDAGGMEAGCAAVWRVLVCGDGDGRICCWIVMVYSLEVKCSVGNDY